MIKNTYMSSSTARAASTTNSIETLVRAKRRRHIKVLSLLLFSVPLISLWALNTGVLDIAMTDWLFSAASSQASYAHAIVWDIRFPRILMTLMTGAGLAICGTVLQALCRNPLADPGLIGVSSGAALFAAIGFYFTSIYALPLWFPAFMVQGLISILAACGAMLALLLLLKVASTASGIDTLMLILAGVAINAGAATMLGFISYLADYATLRQITFWTLGSYAGINLNKSLLATVVIAFAFIFFYRHSHAMMLISASEKQARYQGVNVRRIKLKCLLVVAIAISVCVSFTGIVGFVGLVVPHICRMAISTHMKILLPASALVGAILVTVADTFARTFIAPAELPIGLLTSLIGVPFFVYLIVREKRKVSFV
jgi:iron complex transport system permease protein